MSHTPLVATVAAAATLAVAMTFTSVSTSHAAAYKLKPIPVDPIVETTGSTLTGKQRLNRLFRPHFRVGNPITQSVRNATGDPNIQVIDRRGFSLNRMYSCNYFFLRKNQRVLKCQ
ncbi:MAG: hypothetical protein ABJH63_11910 [Rhizobiaceae bacterium]